MIYIFQTIKHFRFTESFWFGKTSQIMESLTDHPLANKTTALNGHIQSLTPPEDDTSTSLGNSNA